MEVWAFEREMKKPKKTIVYRSGELVGKIYQHGERSFEWFIFEEGKMQSKGTASTMEEARQSIQHHKD